MNNKVENKVKILSDKFTEFFGDNMNLIRIKFFGLFISALCKVQTKCFEKLACSSDFIARMDLQSRKNILTIYANNNKKSRKKQGKRV